MVGHAGSRSLRNPASRLLLELVRTIQQTALHYYMQ